MSFKFLHINNPALDINKYELEADETWNSFRLLLTESISNIELIKYKLKLLSKKDLGRDLNHNLLNQNEVVTNEDSTRNIPELESKTVAMLNSELKETISRSSMSVRRSLLTLSSLLSQHQLIFLPYFEMKACHKQLKDIAEREATESKQKISYGEALESLELLSKEIYKTKIKTDHLEKSASTLSSDTC